MLVCLYTGSRKISPPYSIDPQMTIILRFLRRWNHLPATTDALGRANPKIPCNVIHYKQSKYFCWLNEIPHYCGFLLVSSAKCLGFSLCMNDSVRHLIHFRT